MWEQGRQDQSLAMLYFIESFWGVDFQYYGDVSAIEW